MNSPDYATLGKAVKAKHPEYRNLSDEEVGRAVAKKYPQYAGKPQLLDPNLKEVAAKQYDAVIQQDVLQGAVINLKHNKEVKELDHDLNSATKKATTKLTVTAAEKGMDTVTFGQASLAGELHKLELEKMKVMAGLDVETEVAKAAAIAEIQIKQEAIRNQMALEMEAERDERELKKDQIKWQMEVEAAQRVRAASQHHLLDLQNQLFGQAQLMKQLPAGTLEHEIAQITFEGLKAEMYALTGKNVPASNGPGIKDAPKDSDTRTDEE